MTKTNAYGYGPINGHLIGLAMKEAVRRAIREIRNQQFIAEATSKTTVYNPDKEDFVTSADKAAQGIYVKLLREAFPGYGIVAEENDLSVSCTIPGEDLWFTVDPLDGTKAFIRRQSHGIGTMISLVRDHEVIAAYVGDVMTQEIYGYRPDSDKVHRIADSGRTMLLAAEPRLPLAKLPLLLSDGPEEYSSRAQFFMHPKKPDSGLTKGILVDGGSIGIRMARLWKNEVGMMILRPGSQTPWDLCPILGISHKLGFRFIRLVDKDSLLLRAMANPESSPYKVYREVYQAFDEVLVVHYAHFDEIEECLARMRFL